jgi:hypothetical protein
MFGFNCIVGLFESGAHEDDVKYCLPDKMALGRKRPPCMALMVMDAFSTPFCDGDARIGQMPLGRTLKFVSISPESGSEDFECVGRSV